MAASLIFIVAVFIESHRTNMPIWVIPASILVSMTYALTACKLAADDQVLHVIFSVWFITTICATKLALCFPPKTDYKKPMYTWRKKVKQYQARPVVGNTTQKHTPTEAQAQSIAGGEEYVRDYMQKNMNDRDAANNTPYVKVGSRMYTPFTPENE